MRSATIVRDAVPTITACVVPMGTAAVGGVGVELKIIASETTATADTELVGNRRVPRVPTRLMLASWHTIPGG